FQAEDGIRDRTVTGVQTCALPISRLDRVSPYQCVLAKISLAGRLSAEPVWRLSLVMGLGDCLELGPWELGFSRGRSLQNYRRLKIGRASCRERVEAWGVFIGWKSE